MNTASIFQLLDLLLYAGLRVPQIAEQWADAKAKIDQMREEDRDPTPAELEELRQLVKAPDAAIEDVADQARRNRGG